VEDDPFVALAEKTALEQYGYTVRTVSTGEAAVTAIDSAPQTDLILMDIDLGEGIDGTEAAVLILAEHEIPIIFISSHTEPKIVEKTEKITSYGYVVKHSSITVIDASIKMAFKLFESKMNEQRKEKALEESEARSQVFFDKSVVSMALVALDKKFIDCNEAFCRFTGFGKEEVRKKTIADITWPEDLEKGYAEMKQLMEGTIQSAIIEKRYVTKQGGVVWGELNICFIKKKEAGASYFLASIVDITDRKKAERSDKQLIAEKEMLLREVHHRIKNNLNTINALLVLQAGSLTDKNAVNALEEAGNRVRSMEILYEKIYAATNFSEVNLGEYLPPLIDDIISNFPNRTAVTIRKSVGSFPVQVKQLQPLGIIVNELLTNIMKYAFAGRNDGTISVSAVLDRNRITVTIEDDGNGMPESVSFDHSSGFGLVLVNGLTKQLGGTIRIERGNGTRIVLEFDK